MYSVTMCNPPGGWDYGFPRIMPREIMLPYEFQNWLKECGYPESEIAYAENNSEFYLTDIDLVDIQTFLRENIARVTFTKANGEVREMRCTLRKEYLPPIEEGVEKKERKPNTDAVRVWDLDKSAWRSFRIDSVIHLEGEINPPKTTERDSNAALPQE